MLYSFTSLIAITVQYVSFEILDSCKFCKQVYLYLEYPCYCGQQGTRQHHIKRLSRQQNLSQVLRGTVCQRISSHALSSNRSAAAWRTLRPSGEFVTDVFGDGLSVGDGQKSVLLVRALQDLSCCLVSSNRIGVTTLLRWKPNECNCFHQKGQSFTFMIGLLSWNHINSQRIKENNQ